MKKLVLAALLATFAAGASAAARHPDGRLNALRRQHGGIVPDDDSPGGKQVFQDMDYVAWKPFDGIGRDCRVGLNLTGFSIPSVSATSTSVIPAILYRLSLTCLVLNLSCSG